MVQMRGQHAGAAHEAEKKQERNRVAPARQRDEQLFIRELESREMLMETVLEGRGVYLRDPPLRSVSSERTPRTPSTSHASSVA